MSRVDYLTEDSLLPSGQNFVCLSFLTDKDTGKTLTGIKVRGVFNTDVQAKEHAKKLQSVDPYSNVFVGDMGKWLPIDPDPETIKDSEYANEQLNTMMKGYMENQEKAKLFYEQRKNEMIRDNLVDNLKSRKDNLTDLTKKLKKSKSTDEQSSLETSMSVIEEQIKKLEDKKSDIEATISTIEKEVSAYTQQQQQNMTLPRVIE